MPKRGLAALLAGLALAFGAAALEEAQWPPPAGEAARMRELQQALSARDSTPGQREAARSELGRLLMRSGAASPSALGEGLREGRPARAAIQPFPSIPAPAPKAPPPVDPSDVARLEVVPPRATVNPRTGGIVAPTGSTAFDLRTGAVLQETPSGYIDPRTGQLIPK